MRENLSSVLAGGRDYDIALIEVGDGAHRTYTYAALRAKVDGLGRGLAARFAPGFRVAILARNSAAFIIIYFAVMRAGGVIVPFNPRASEEAVAFLVRDAAIDLVLTDDAGLLANGAPRILIGSEEWGALHDPGPLDGTAVDDATIAQILYTSGSTGTPKGVPLTHSGQYWAVVEGARLIRDPAGYRVMVAAPLFHMNALFNVKRTFYTGGTIVLLPGFTPASFASTLATYRCDLVSGVPTMLAMLAQHLGDSIPREFAAVRYLFVGSAPYSDALVASARKLFPRAEFANFYGTTEAGPTVFGRHPDGRETPALSCGYPLFPEMLRVVDDEGRVVEGPGRGVLHMRTPATMAGYLNRPEASAAVLRDGWYDSHDVVTRDDDGFLYFLGRTDDMFISGGHNIYPAEVEKVLETHPAIAQAVVVPAPDPIKHEIPVAFVVSRDGREIAEAATKAWFIEQAPPYLHPRRIFTLPQIPLAQTNKIDRTRLKAMARERVQQPPAAASA